MRPCGSTWTRTRCARRPLIAGSRSRRCATTRPATGRSCSATRSCPSRRSAPASPSSRTLSGFREVVAVELEEALHARLLTAELLGHAARVVGGDLEEVLQAALRVVRQRVHARDILLRTHDAHRRAALRERAGAAHGGDDDALLGRDERG